jgi:tetratricopeptide (TPR) repeat protein
MAYDLFISYSRRDNERGQVAALKAQIESSFRAFAGRDIRFFFDTQEIQGMDDWRQKIQRSLRESHIFLAVLSPNYIASPYCRWEWEDYVRYEAMRQCLGEGVAPVFFVTLPNAATTQLDPSIVRWIEEINQRQTFDLRPWREHGEKALQEAHVRTTLEELHASIRERLSRAEQALLSPNNLIKHNAAFVGRVRELTDLRNALAKNKLGVVGARQGKAIGPVAVQGLGGMGKTELALAYAHAFAWDYPGGRWQIPCEYTADLRLALTRLAVPMHFEFTEEEKKDLALQFERVLREIQRRERCLLILDNVSDPHLLEPEYLDRLPRDGHVDLIATTRLAPASIPGGAQEFSFIAVDELPEEDALALMRSHQPEGRFASPDEDNEARLIVRLLRGFTLAVETAAIYLGRHPAPDACRQFRERLSPALLRESEQAATDPVVAVRHRVRSLDETLAFTLATLTPEAMHLLTFAALLPADQVAVPWLRVLGAGRYPAFQDTASTAFNQPLELLLGLRLFQPGEAVDADGHLLIVRMHRLVQELMRQKAVAEEIAAMQQAVNALITERDAALDKITEWAPARWELEPLTALAGQWDETSHPRAAWLLNQMSLYWHRLAEWGRSEPLMRLALAIDERSYGPDHPNVAIRLNNLAALLQDTNRLKDAEPVYRRALAIDERSYGPDHPKVATNLNNLAQLLRATNRLSEAEPLMRRALDLSERSFGPNHPNVAIRLSNLATLLQATNRLAEAEPLMRRALDLSERSYGPDHPDVAIRLNNLAALLRATSRLAEAEPLMRRALAIDEQSYGPDHPKVARDLNNLAQLLQATNRLGEAEPLMRRALAIDERSYDLDHPNIAKRLNNLAGLLMKTNRLAEAEPLYRRALAIDERSYGPDHPDIATDLNNLALLLKATNRLGEAEPLMRRALEIDEQSYEPDHTNVARDLNNIARLLQDTNRRDEAEPLMRRVVEILLKFTRSTGHPHPRLQAAIINYAGLLDEMGRSEKQIRAMLHEIAPEIFR